MRQIYVCFVLSKFTLCWQLSTKRRWASSRRSALFASVVSCGVPRLLLAGFGVLSRRRFASVVSDRIPGLIYAKYVTWRRRCDDWRRDFQPRFASKVSYGVPRRLLAGFGVMSPRRYASVWQCRVVWIPWAHVRKVWTPVSASRQEASWRSTSFCHHRVEWHPKAHQRFVWNLGRLRGDWHGDARRRFASKVPFASRGSSWLDLVLWVGVVTMGVNWPPSCRMRCRGSSWLHLESFVSVVSFIIPLLILEHYAATLGVCVPESGHVASQGSSIYS
jgi:hypothetical protein